MPVVLLRNVNTIVNRAVMTSVFMDLTVYWVRVVNQVNKSIVSNFRLRYLLWGNKQNDIRI